MASRLRRLGRRWIVAGIMGALLSAWAVLALAAPPSQPDAEALWRHINQQDNFRNWGTWQDFDTKAKSFMPYGFYRRIYVNATARQAKGNPLPAGSILVWEGYGMDDNTYAPTDQVVAYGVMYKLPGFNPQAGDWFWVHYSGTGKVMESGPVNKCIDCHDTARDNDWVLDHKLAQGHPDTSAFTPPAAVQEDRLEPPLQKPRGR